MKLFVLALLVASVAGFAFPKIDTKAIVQGVQDVVRLQAEDSSDDTPPACLVKLGPVYAQYQYCGQAISHMETKGFWNQSTMTEFCVTNNCGAFFDAVASILSTASECLIPTPTPHRPAMLAQMQAMKPLFCTARNNIYCLPFMLNMDSLFPDMEHKQITPAIMDATICHPCTTAMIDMIRVREQLSKQNGTMTIFITSIVTLMCRQNPVTHTYCLPGIQELQHEINDTDFIKPNTQAWVDKWTVLLPKLCVDPCFSDFVLGMAMLTGDEGDMGGVIRMQSFCVRDMGVNPPKYCALRMIEKQFALGWPQSECLTPMDLADEHEHPVCSAECALKFQHLLNETGCCARSLLVNSAPHYRDNVRNYTIDACHVEWPTTAECLARIKLVLRVIVFRNLRYDWVIAHKAEVEANLKKDFAAALKVLPDDITLNFGQLASHPGAISTFATTTGTTVTPTVTANSDQQSSIVSTSNTNMNFPALSNTVTADAAINPNQPAYQADQNSATSAFISVMVLMIAGIVALLL